MESWIRTNGLMLVMMFISLLFSQEVLSGVSTKNISQCKKTLGVTGGFCELTTKISSVFPSDLGYNNRFGLPKNVLVAWGGAAYDKANKTFYFMGGGHSDYAGNEVYSFDLNTSQWKRLNDPSPLEYIGFVSGSSTNYIRIPDIRVVPGASHSYDGLQYREETGTILFNVSTPSGRVLADGEGDLNSPNFISSQERKAIYEFNPSESDTRNQLAPLTWRKVSREKLYYPRTAILGDGTFIVGDKSRLYKATFSPDNQLITELTRLASQADWGEGNLVYDSKRDLLWSIQSKSLIAFNPSTGTKAYKITDHPTKGKSLAIGDGGELVIWDGCSTIEMFTPETNTWDTKHWGDMGAQPCNQYNGYDRVYGKWQHVEGRVFAGVVNADHGVMIYVKPKTKKILTNKGKKNNNLPTLGSAKSLIKTVNMTLAQRVKQYEAHLNQTTHNQNSSLTITAEKKQDPVLRKASTNKKDGTKNHQNELIRSDDGTFKRQLPFGDYNDTKVKELLPAYGIATHRVSADLDIAWHGAGGERSEIGLIPEQHAAFLAGQIDLKGSILEAALVPPPVMFDHAHHPNQFWLPYLLTGNPVYIANMEVGYKSYKDWRSQPYDSAIKMMSGREGAWNLRDLVQLAYLQEKGLTKQTYYIAALNATRDRWLGIVANPIASQAMFNVLDFNSAGSNTYGFTGWMQYMLGQAINYTAIITKDPKWGEVAAWHFQHLLKSSGDKWPLKAVGYNHVFMYHFMQQGNKATWREAYDFAQTATWETITPYTLAVMTNLTYQTMSDDHIAPASVKVGSFALTYANRAQYAYGWAVLACKNNIARACDKAKQLFDEITLRGDRWDYKNSFISP